MTARSLLGLGVAAVVLVAAVWIAALLAGTPLLIVAAAALPAALYAAAIVWIQRGAGRLPALLAASVVWGAVAAAFLSHALNELGRAWMALLAGADDARALTSTLFAPAIEEAAKAAGLVLAVVWGRRLAGVRDGIIYGALIGVGFVLTENLIYFAFAALQGGPSGLARSVYLRGLLAGADHAVFTATIGAGIGWAAASSSTRERVLAPLLACLAALVLHVAWNAVASDAITRVLCGAETAGGPCRPTPAARDLFGVAPVLVLCFLGPAAVVLARLYARAPAARNWPCE